MPKFLAILLVILLLLGSFVLLAGQASPGTDPAIKAAQAQATANIAQAQKQATQQAGDRQVAIIAATQQAEQAQNEAQQAEQARQATQQAWAVVSTATAGPAQTLAALEAQATSQAIAGQATSLAQSLRATQGALDYATEQQALALERERLTNQIRALGGYGLGAILLGVFIFLALVIIRRLTRIQHIAPDEKGRLGVIVVNGERIIDPALLPSAVLDPSRPQQIDPDQALAIKTNAQKLQAIQALAGTTEQPKALGAAMAPTLPMVVDTREPEQIEPLIDEVEGKLLERGHQ